MSYKVLKFYNFVGVTVWEILTFGARPYPGIKAKELLGSIYKGVRLQQPETCSHDLYNELLKCELKQLLIVTYII